MQANLPSFPRRGRGRSRWAIRHRNCEREYLDGVLPEKAGARLFDSLGAVWETINVGSQPAAATPLNRPVGTHRRFDWLALDLAEVKAVWPALASRGTPRGARKPAATR